MRSRPGFLLCTKSVKRRVTGGGRHQPANTKKRPSIKGGTMTRVMVEDGKSCTVAAKGTNPEGEPVNNVFFLERQ